LVLRLRLGKKRKKKVRKRDRAWQRGEIGKKGKKEEKERSLLPTFSYLSPSHRGKKGGEPSIRGEEKGKKREGKKEEITVSLSRVYNVSSKGEKEGGKTGVA